MPKPANVAASRAPPSKRTASCRLGVPHFGIQVQPVADQESSSNLSPTVAQVLDRFVAALRADDGIDNDAIDRLDKLLRKGIVPKPEDINAALFEPPPEAKP